MPHLPDSALYAVTDAGLSLGRDTLTVVRLLLEAGIKIIQYREKSLSRKQMLEECMAIRVLTREAGCCFIVNDTVDIAMVCKADGVHVGQDDMPLWAVRELVGKNCLVGVSVRDREEADAAIAGGADYLGAGAVFPTATKQDAVHAGLEFVEALVRQSPIPVVAIGGINEGNIADLAGRGIQWFALVSALVAAPCIDERVRLLRTILAGSQPHDTGK